MTDDQLRALVRETVARHLGVAPGMSQGVASPASAPAVVATSVVVLRDPSHYRYALASGDDEDGPCFIEPSVRCNHCGYCQSHGH
jgi:hypothetical protein